jgi:hypothetical protein
MIWAMMNRCLNNEAMRIAIGWAFAADAKRNGRWDATGSQRMKSLNLWPPSAPNDHSTRPPVSMYRWQCAKIVLLIRCPA